MIVWVRLNILEPQGMQFPGSGVFFPNYAGHGDADVSMTELHKILVWFAIGYLSHWYYQMGNWFGTWDLPYVYHGMVSRLVKATCTCSYQGSELGEQISCRSFYFIPYIEASPFHDSDSRIKFSKLDIWWKDSFFNHCCMTIWKLYARQLQSHILQACRFRFS